MTGVLVFTVLPVETRTKSLPLLGATTIHLANNMNF